VLAGAGHYVIVEKPREVAAEIGALLRQPRSA
jgi:pimeloyl-ACP methyl ester carboxylesterase